MVHERGDRMFMAAHVNDDRDYDKKGEMKKKGWEDVYYENRDITPLLMS
jgi:hypothetical protein